MKKEKETALETERKGEKNQRGQALRAISSKGGMVCGRRKR